MTDPIGSRWNPDGFLKVFDHITNKVHEGLPVPVYKGPSFQFALKNAGTVAIAILVIGIIATITMAFNKTVKTTNYDKEGNVIPEKKKVEKKRIKCKDTLYEDGTIKTFEIKPCRDDA